MLVRIPMNYLRTPDTHDQTLRMTRVRKIPQTASAAIAAAAVPKLAKQTDANTTATYGLSSTKQWLRCRPNCQCAPRVKLRG
ncbi:uncharacterized protein CCR75_009473 [Bremia lactucae]|uniref:Uncharacterized protein n=1 Tax=Bremia lactucae TaxID=4779 RepID=A0A976FHG3_BRELC|nr:hypothetical protein CCR75_009473 [Bremia lactucae]